MVTLVRSDGSGEVISTHIAMFTEPDAAFVRCALDAAWTAFKEKRSDQIERLLSEVVSVSHLTWWLLNLTQCIRPPQVG